MNLLNLSDDGWLEVLSFISYSDLVRFSEVSRKAYDLVSKDSLWKEPAKKWGVQEAPRRVNLIAVYCFFGADFINKHFFNGERSVIRFALLVTALFIVGYPIWGWKRNSIWARIGRWSFAKWVLAGVGVGIYAILVDILAGIVVNHYSAQ